MTKLPPVHVMINAFARKDRAYDGIFFVGVKTTGVFCRPVCRAKPAKPQNVEFYPTAAEAVRNGYRPCKLCRPMGAGGVPPLVTRLIQRVEQANGDRLTERALLELRIDPSTARRQFKAFCGMTFSEYQRRHLMGHALQEISNGESMTTAQLTAGFKSSSGFRAAMAGLLDAEPANARSTPILTAAWIDTPLGVMLAVADDEGLLRLDFSDEGRAERVLEKIRDEHSGAAVAVVPGENRHLRLLRREIEQYFSGKLQQFTVALAPRGTPFELKAWHFLRSIPYAQTRSYGEQARSIGSPGAARAVGRANGRNPIALVVPCHRVIGANGSLTGFGGGLARKQWLLDHERKFAGLSDLFHQA